MPSWVAWAQTSNGLIKAEGSASTFLREATLIKVENVSWK